MCLKCDLTKVLGVDKKAISDKSAEFAKEILEGRVHNTTDVDKINKYMDDNFSVEELKILAVSFIMQQTQSTIRDMAKEGNPIALAVMLGKTFDETGKIN